MVSFIAPCRTPEFTKGQIYRRSVGAVVIKSPAFFSYLTLVSAVGPFSGSCDLYLFLIFAMISPVVLS
jgi:hypothetical protein